ncbi:MAG: alpha-amylase family glycosyl hydrolase [Metamycoplasmataceae bacterium]
MKNQTKTYKDNLSLIGVSLPILIMVLISVSAPIINTLIVSLSGNGSQNIQAVGIASQISSLFSTLITLVSGGIGVVIGALIGKKKEIKVIQNSILSIMLIGIIFSLIIYALAALLFPILIPAFGAGFGDLIYLQTLEYGELISITIIISTITATMSISINSYGYSAHTSFISIAGIFLDLILTFILVYIIDLGTLGSALGTIIAQSISFLLIFIIFNLKIMKLTFKNFVFEKKVIKKLIKISLPISIEKISYTFAMTILGIIVSQGALKFPGIFYFPETEKNYLIISRTMVSTFINLITVTSLAFASGAEILVSRKFGAKDLEGGKKYLRKALWISLVVDIFLAIAFCIIGKFYLIDFFAIGDKDFYTPERISIFNTLIFFPLIVSIFLQGGRTLNLIFLVGARASGNVRLNSILSVITTWIIIFLSFLISYVFLSDNPNSFLYGINGVFLAMALDEILRGIINYIIWIKRADKMKLDLKKNKIDWWKKVVVYQVYPRSFYDSDNDGNGDLKGIIKKLDYLKKLGIGAIWLGPIYKSPMIDNGYDVEDYFSINELYGTMDDFDKLINEANKREIKIILDIVPNHTSDTHKWFKAALDGDEKYKDYYVFKDEPILEIDSVFGGCAWTQHKDQWYLHKFAPTQVDLNWTNKNVRDEFKKITDFWIKKGVFGFRFDVIDDIAKNLDLEKINKGENIDIKRLHEYVYEWRNDSIWKNYDLLTVGESWDASVEKAIMYSNPKNKELAMVFGFEHMTTNWTNNKWNQDEFNLVKFKTIIEKWQMGLYQKGWNSIFLNNHDFPRLLSNFGNDKKYRIESGKCISLTMHFLQGTPYIFQGEEIGMVNTDFDSLNEHNDVEIHQLFKIWKENDINWTEEKHLSVVKKMNRDNARTPMQWSDEENAGFSNVKPWLKVNDNYKKINCKNALEDNDSLFYWYKKLIALRSEKNELQNIIIEGSFEIEKIEDEKLFIYKRKLENKWVKIIANWTDEKVELNEDLSEVEVIINNYDLFDNKSLSPWQVIVIKNS